MYSADIPATMQTAASCIFGIICYQCEQQTKIRRVGFLSYLLTQPCQENMKLRLPVNDSVLQVQLTGLLEKETITQHEIDMFYQMVDGLQAADYPTTTVEQIIREELAPYLAGEAAEEETAGKIQSRVQLMLAEQFD